MLQPYKIRTRVLTFLHWKMGQFWSKSATLNIFKFPYFVFFAMSGKFHAIWLKNKEAIAVQNLVCKILGLHLVRNSNRNISATVWRLARKFWYNIVCKKEQHIKTKKRWWPPWSNFVWVLCAFAFNCFHLVNLILGFISSLLSTKLLQVLYYIFLTLDGEGKTPYIVLRKGLSFCKEKIVDMRFMLSSVCKCEILWSVQFANFDTARFCKFLLLYQDTI